MKVVLFEIYKNGVVTLRYRSGEALTLDELARLNTYITQLIANQMATRPRKEEKT